MWSSNWNATRPAANPVIVQRSIHERALTDLPCSNASIKINHLNRLTQSTPRHLQSFDNLHRAECENSTSRLSADSLKPSFPNGQQSPTQLQTEIADQHRRRKKNFEFGLLVSNRTLMTSSSIGLNNSSTFRSSFWCSSESDLNSLWCFELSLRCELTKPHKPIFAKIPSTNSPD